MLNNTVAGYLLFMANMSAFVSCLQEGLKADGNDSECKSICEACNHRWH